MVQQRSSRDSNRSLPAREVQSPARRPLRRGIEPKCPGLSTGESSQRLACGSLIARHLIVCGHESPASRQEPNFSSLAEMLDRFRITVAHEMPQEGCGCVSRTRLASTSPGTISGSVDEHVVVYVTRQRARRRAICSERNGGRKSGRELCAKVGDGVKGLGGVSWGC